MATSFIVGAAAAAVLLLLVYNAVMVEPAPTGARVHSLPGFSGTFPSPQYAGYITVDEKNERKLYYYFVTSANNPKTDPVVLWMNGGPGCSSFDGFIYEHGPFSFKVNSTPGGLPSLEINRYSWTTVASIIYLDQPAGVGFSYSNNISDYNTDDFQAAKDVHTFLLKWFAEYAEFQSNSFYVSGESYAGVYVPIVTKDVADGIKNGAKPSINLKGYLIGNGVTNDKFDTKALLPFVHGMGLIPDELYEAIKKLCHSTVYWNANNSACSKKVTELYQDIVPLNLYDILEPCYHSTSAQHAAVKHHRLPKSFRRLGETERPLPVRRRMSRQAWPSRSPVRTGRVPSWYELVGDSPPCMNYEVANEWLNDASVREAIHAQPVSAIGTWVICSDKVSYNEDAGSMLPYHKTLLNAGYRALIYSGDHDMAVPFTGSEAWTRSLGHKVVKEWHPWFTNNQVSGYSVTYAKNLTFATVKGAGHTVPQYKPQEALTLFQTWLSGDSL